MTVVGIDDTDSREGGMCTTYVAARVAAELRDRGASVATLDLVRLNPAVPHKTRGNAALAIHTDAAVETAETVATEWVAERAIHADEDTHPGVVVAPGGAEDIPPGVRAHAATAVTSHHDLEATREHLQRLGWPHRGFGEGRGLIGALAAVGASGVLESPTYELIAYRLPERRGTPRAVDRDSVFTAADRGYPTVWDTVDRGAEELVCVPNTPGPILYGIRGDTPEAVRSVAADIESEPVERTTLFSTNQGTDGHLQSASLGDVTDGESYRVSGRVARGPETREGGHVHLSIANGGSQLHCVAFEPTKRFRKHVRALRNGDRVTVCGEVTDGTLKLEKFAVRDLVRETTVTPTCPECGRSMSSAGRDQGYRCRRCDTAAPDRERTPLQRDLELGWYEVPPRARRHIAKPLVRGGFDAQTHPES